MEDTNLESLLEAIARNSAAVLSLPSAGLLRHHKTRFLASADGCFYLESAPEDAALIDNLIVAQVPVGVSYRSATAKAVFAAPILCRESQFAVNAQLRVEALKLPLPASVKAVQRRSNYRVHIPSNCPIVIRAWRLNEQAVLRDRPSATLEIAIATRDLSLGGMCILCPPKDGKPLVLAADQRLRVVIQYNEMEAVVEGRVRHAQLTPDKSIRAGVQFRKLETDIEGRQTLARLTAIVGLLQREEVRRMRLGLTG